MKKINAAKLKNTKVDDTNTRVRGHTENTSYKPSGKILEMSKLLESQLAGGNSINCYITSYR